MSRCSGGYAEDSESHPANSRVPLVCCRRQRCGLLLVGGDWIAAALLRPVISILITYNVSWFIQPKRTWPSVAKAADKICARNYERNKDRVSALIPQAISVFAMFQTKHNFHKVTVTWTSDRRQPLQRNSPRTKKKRRSVGESLWLFISWHYYTHTLEG